jgi:hypothetical protein
MKTGPKIPNEMSKEKKCRKNPTEAAFRRESFRTIAPAPNRINGNAFLEVSTLRI